MVVVVAICRYCNGSGIYILQPWELILANGAMVQKLQHDEIWFDARKKSYCNIVRLLSLYPQT
jgi:hypothetical protein